MYVLRDGRVKLTRSNPYNEGDAIPVSPVAMPKRKRFDQKKEVRKLARERVGTVKPARAIVPKVSRKKPKHKKGLEADTDGL